MLNKNYGFTLLELLIVIIIISISLSIIVPRITTNDRKVLMSYGRMVVNFLKFAKYQSLFKRSEVKIKINTKEKKFILSNTKKKLQIKDKTIDIKLSTPDKENTIYFFPSGISTPFSLYLIKGRDSIKITFDSVNGTFVLRNL